MICKKCGKALPSEGAVCNFCGAMMNKEQLEQRKKMQDSNFQAKLMSDRYGVDKKALYSKEESQKENKLIGIAVILGILLFLIILVIIVNVGR